MARPNRKRLAVDLPNKLFEMVKEACDLHGCTITKYVIASLMKNLKTGEIKINDDKEK